jgi:phosphatidylglycerophosphate synthase
MKIERAASNQRALLHRRAIVAVCAAFVLAALAATAAGRALPVGPAYVPKVLGVFALMGGFVLARLDGHPFDRFGAANGVTLLRAVLTALAAGLVGEGGGAEIAAFAATTGGTAVALDFVDGRVARASGLASPFGARFDMETDAALVLVLALLAWQTGRTGAWIIVAGLLRYIFVFAGAAVPWMRRPLPPSARRRVAAAVQMLALVAALALAPPVGTAVAGAALALLCYSFAADTLWLYRHSLEEPG